MDVDDHYLFVLDFEVAMDIGSGIMLPVDTEGNEMAVVPKSAKRTDEQGIVRFGIFFFEKSQREYFNFLSWVCAFLLFV